MKNQHEDQSLSSWTMPTVAQIATSPLDTETLQLSVIPRHESIGLRSNHVTTCVCVNVTSAEMQDMDDDLRAPIDIVVALDLSGSMAGAKINDCKKTLEVMLRNLKSTDRFALISYAYRARVEFSALLMTCKNKEAALKSIQSLKANGSTNLSAGLSLAFHELNSIHDSNPVRSVFLLTDGHANVGVTDVSQLESMVRSFASPTVSVTPLKEDMRGLKLANNDGSVGDSSLGSKPDTIMIHNSVAPLSLFCFGYGSDHNSEMLERIAKATQGGAYYFVEQGTDSNVSAAFGNAMGGLLSVVAQSAVVTITLPDSAAEMGVKILEVYHDEAIRRGENHFTVNLGDFYSEESRDILFDLQLTKAISDDPLHHGIVSLSYSDTVKGTNVVLVPVFCLLARPDSYKVSPVNRHVEEQWMRLRTVEAIRVADAQAKARNFGAARQVLHDHKTKMDDSRAMGTLNDEFHSHMTRDIDEMSRGLANASTYEKRGGHTMRTQQFSHTKQRCMKSAPTTSTMYANNKMQMTSLEYHTQSREE